MSTVEGHDPTRPWPRWVSRETAMADRAAAHARGVTAGLGQALAIVRADFPSDEPAGTKDWPRSRLLVAVAEASTSNEARAERRGSRMASP